MQNTQSLSDFLGRVAAGVDRAIAESGLDAQHQALLSATVGRFRAHSTQSPLSEPVILFDLISRAERGVPDDAGIELAVFCQFYLAALDLFDDVQDEDLAGKAHAEVGPAIAVNSALYLLFSALGALERGMRGAGSSEDASAYLEVFARVAKLTVRGQYRDLESRGLESPDQVLEIAREKTASLTLICELAALYATPDLVRRERYRRIGEDFSLFVQVLDDLRDVFGKSVSPDLELGRPSYPLACFREQAEPEQLEQLERLRATRPMPLREIRALLYECGIVQRVAETLEGFRRAIHAEVSALDRNSPWLRMLLFTLDGLASSVYLLKRVPESEAVTMPASGWHGLVRKHAKNLVERLAAYGLPEPPPLVPWHLPQWLYDPSRKQIFYADIEGLPEETLPFQAALLGETDIEVVKALMLTQTPAVVAHELFHYYRDRTSRLGSDMWEEELAANSLAIAYIRDFEPDVLDQTVALAERVLARSGNDLSPLATSILDGLTADPPRTPGGGYDLPLGQMALVQMGMIRHLARRGACLDDALRYWLGVEPAGTPREAALPAQL